jgi:uncharacterized protein YndB with AHSA1/START domain
MAGTTSSSAAGQARQKLLLTRIFGTPRSLVFTVWTDPQHMARRWGPRRFTNPVCELDVRIVYLEVVEPEHLVYDHFGEEGNQREKFQTTVTFLGQGTATEVVMRAVFPTVAVREFAVENTELFESGKQTLERLAEFVGSGSVKN